MKSLIIVQRASSTGNTLSYGQTREGGRDDGGQRGIFFSKEGISCSKEAKKEAISDPSYEKETK